MPLNFFYDLFYFFVTFPVPSVYPRNVTVQLNESWLMIRWKPPPEDKINGILRGYDVIVRHGTHEKKVSLSKNNSHIPTLENLIMDLK